MRKFINLFPLLLATIVLTTSVDVMARRGRGDGERGTSMKLTFDGGLNDAQSKVLKAPLEILAWSWGAANGPVCKDENSDCGKNVPRLQELSLTKYIGLESPTLAQMIMAGQPIKTVVLNISNSGSNMVLTMKNTKVSSTSMGGSGGEERLTENISIDFESVEIKYEELKEGKVAASNTATVETKK